MTLEEQVMSKVAEALKVDPAQITPGTTSNDLEAWDSMGTMSILFALTNHFGITLQPNETGRLQSVRSILELVRNAGAGS
jgi:acyl carrier protein